jgi:hypothetical protein
MKNPGVYLLTYGMSGNLTVRQLEGMTAVTLEFEFKHGTGGEGCHAIVQTSIAGGAWRDIARADFGKDTVTKHCNLEGLLSKGVTLYRPLEAEGVYDGVLGDALRCIVDVKGEYVDSELTVRASVR